MKTSRKSFQKKFKNCFKKWVFYNNVSNVLYKSILINSISNNKQLFFKCENLQKTGSFKEKTVVKDSCW